MFLDEARLAARIHHPNVVSILEVGTSEEGYYLVMEYIEGDTAARLVGRTSQAGGLPAGIARRGLPMTRCRVCTPPTSSRTTMASCSRLCTATCRRRTSSWASTARRASRISASRTRRPVSSEHADGAARREARVHGSGTSARGRCRSPADVFAMGVVLWELLAGKRLFKASNDAETLHRIPSAASRRCAARASTCRSLSTPSACAGSRATREERYRSAAGVRGPARPTRVRTACCRRPGRSPCTWTARLARRFSAAPMSASVARPQRAWAGEPVASRGPRPPARAVRFEASGARRHGRRRRPPPSAPTSTRGPTSERCRWRCWPCPRRAGADGKPSLCSLAGEGTFRAAVHGL